MKQGAIRILVATPLYPPDIGGPATHAIFLEKELPAEGIQVTMVSFGSIRRVPKLFRHLLFFLAVVWKGVQVDAIYALDAVSVGVPSRVAAFMLRKPFMLRVPGDYAWEQGVQRFGVKSSLDTFQKEEGLPVPVKFFRWTQSLVARSAAAVIVPSEYLKTIVSSWRVSIEQISVAYSRPEFVPLLSRSEARKKLNMHEDEVLVLSAGRLVPWKGFLGLLDAFKMASGRLLRARLYIAGGGPERASILSLIQRLGLSDQVFLLGEISRVDLGLYMAASDVFVLNTKYEGLSHQLIETLQAGIPIVTTPVGGNTEIIKDGVSGLLVSPDDADALAQAIVRVIEEPTLKRILVSGGTRVVEELLTKASASVIASVLKKAIN